MKCILRIKKLNYFVRDKQILDNIDLNVYSGDRIALIGANGCGKSTLLKCISRFHMFSCKEFVIDEIPGKVWSDQRNGFAYLGGSWVQNKGFQGIQPYYQDIKAGMMMKSWQDANIKRRDELVSVLGINLSWNMSQVSDGQRQKVRIMLKLLRPFQCCVIDEFDTTLDLLARQRLAEYLVKETKERNACVICATHIFDRPMKCWANKVMFMSKGKLSDAEKMSDIDSLHDRTIDFLKKQPIQSYVEQIRPTEDSGYESGRSQLFWGKK